MKTLLLLARAAALALALLPLAAFAQTPGVGIGTTSPAASAALEVSSTTKGLLPPRLSQSQRDLIGSPAAGLTIYNTTTNKPNVWNGTSWTEALTTTEQPITYATTTFNYTGGVQTYTVPAGVTKVLVDASGAQGGNVNPAGLGAQVQATLPVVPGQVLYLYVGGAGISATIAGGYNGGGNGRSAVVFGYFGYIIYGGGGGGASDVRTSASGTAYTNRLLVAAGGGGGGGLGDGGAGGAPTGRAGGSTSGSGPGTGASTTAGGSANGTLGQGGLSGTAGGGGGGGGSYGGGGGLSSYGSGGGGSSWVDGTGSAVSMVEGARSGNGVVSITPAPLYAAPALDASNFVNVPGDNLGNHTATTNLNLADKLLVGNGGSAGLAVSSIGGVGIGGAAPAANKLAVLGSGTGAQPLLLLRNSSGGGGNGVGIDLQTYDPGTNPGSARIQALDDGAASAHLGFLTKAPGGAGNALTERLRIASNGNVGIGTTTPAQALDVTGNTNVTGNSYVGGSVGIGTTSPTQALDVRGHLRLGNDGGNVSGTGQAVEFVGPGQNTDPVGLYRVNPASDQSELRVVVGDVADANDKFSVGRSTVSGVGGIPTGTFTPNFTVKSDGTVGIAGLAGTGTRMVTTDASGTLAPAILPTDAQALSISGSTISLTNGGSVTVPSSADNLGNHTATQNLNLGSNALVGTTAVNVGNNLNLGSNLLVGNGGTAGLAIDNGGKVGIGTTAPTQALDVRGHLRLGNDGGNVTGTGQAVEFVGPGLNTDPVGLYRVNTASDASELRVVVGDVADANDKFSVGRTSATSEGGIPAGTFTPNFTVQSNGAVGIAGLAGTGTRMVTADASGNLTSAAIPTFSGDNLGNHTATQALSLGSNQLVGNGGSSGLAVSSTGGVGIGGAAPAANKLALVGSGTGPQPLLLLRNTSGGAGNGVGIDLQTYDPGANPGSARIAALDDGAASGHLTFLTKAPGGAGNALTERLRIASNGNVGIGTSTPGQALEVAGAVSSLTAGTQALLRLNRPDNVGVKYGNALDVQVGSYGTTNQAQTQVDFRLSNGNTDTPDMTALSLLGNGNVGIGTTAPGSKLAVVGSGTGAQPLLLLRNTSGGTGNGVGIDLQTYDPGANPGTARIQVTDDGAASANLSFLTKLPGGTGNALTERLRIASGGNVGIGTSTPAQALEVAGAAAPLTVGTAAQLRLSRPATSGTKFANSFDLALGSYATGINSQTRLDFNLGNGGTNSPDMTALSLLGSGSVGMGTTAPAASAQLEVASTTRGFLPPRLSQTQRDGIGSPATGLIIYNTDTNKLNVWNGTAWTEASTTTDLAPVAGITFNYTGAVQTYTVPAGVTQLLVTAAGAQGDNSSASSGGGGATVGTTLAVTPGEVLNLYVGGTGSTENNNSNTPVGGGYNGGGNATFYGGGGGGGTDIRRGGTALADRVVVAAGGGGAYSTHTGGGGGGPVGGDGQGGPGSGAQQYGGSTNGALGQGAQGNGSGAGGGGYQGGGAFGSYGYSQGGGGGSSWVDPSTTAGTGYVGGNRRGPGYLTLLPVTVPQPTAAVSGGNVQMLQLTQAQRDALTNPTAGLLIYNLTTGRLNFYTGTGWVEFFAAGETGTQVGAAQTYYPTGTMQTYTVPAGVTQLSVDAKGGAGGYYQYAGLTVVEGKGTRVQATLAVVPGQVLNLFVGGQGQNYNDNYAGSVRAGGLNGGGNGGYNGGAGGGGGGGATDIRTGGTAVADRVLVAAGGGGAGANNSGNFGGAGGAPLGGNGGAASGYSAGAGGTQSAGGAGGQGANAASTSRAGGGGGGYFGGGVATGGGGGGSSYVGAGLSNVQYSVLPVGGGGSLMLTPVGTLPAPALNGSNFVNVPAANLTGSVPAASLTSVPAASLTGVVAVVNLPALTSSASGTNRTLTLGTGNSTTISVGDDLGSHNATTRLNLGTQVLVGNGGSTGLSITSTGNVGIGTAATQALDVNGGILARSNSVISNQGAYLQWNRSGGDGETSLLNQRGSSSPNAGIRFGDVSAANAVTEYARFAYNGNFGIGTTAPGHPLTVQADGGGKLLGLNTAAGGDKYNWSLTNGGLNLSESNVAGGRLFVQDGGNVGIGTTNPGQALTVIGSICASGGLNCASDGRYKRNVVELPHALASVLRLRGVTYYWKQAEFPAQRFPATRQLGFIAQEVEPLYPEMVTTDADGYKSVDYARLTPVLVEALKEQQAQIEALKAEAGAARAEATAAKTQAAQATAATEAFGARLRRLEAGGAQAQR